MADSNEIFYKLDDFKKSPYYKTHVKYAFQVRNKDGKPSFRYSYVKNHDDLFKLKTKHVYEMVRGTKPLKLFFDIEFTNGEPEYVIRTGISQILRDIYILFKRQEHEDCRMIVLQCHRPIENAMKWSFHVIVINKAFNMNYIKKFVDEIKSRTLSLYKYAIDTTVYSSRRNFRILGSSKITSPDYPMSRSKYGIENFRSIDTLIQYIDDLPIVRYEPSTISQLIFGKEASTKKKFPAISASAKIDKILNDQYPEFTIRSRSPVIVLKRLSPSLCEFCDRTHDKDNSHFIIKSLIGEFFIMCRKYNEENGQKRKRKSLDTGVMETYNVSNDLTEESVTAQIDAAFAK